MSIKRALIVCDAIGAPLYAPRVRYLCKMLHDRGVYVHLVTEKFKELPFHLPYKFTEIPCYNGSKLDWALKNVLSLLFDYKNKAFYRRLNKLVEGESYDVVVCSTFHTFGLYASYKIAKKLNVPLHVDLRDIAEQTSANDYSNSAARRLSCLGKFYRYKNINRRNKVIRLAKSVTSVSPWHVDFLKQYNPNASLVYNGYDEDVFVPQTIKEPTFDIVYAGKWYGRQMQDPTLLFETLQKVKGTIPELRLKFYTAADVHNEILKMASDYCVEDIVSLYDYVANEEVPELLNRASIVLVLSNVGTNGVMTTKLFEAVGVEKPVLCVRSDDGDLEAFIENENVGRACRDVVQVEQAITEVYAQWKENGFTKSFVQRKKIYTRYLQTEKLVEIIFRR